jgi:hypothetical protein
MTKTERRAKLQKEENCDCTDNQWIDSGSHCTRDRIRCQGRFDWKAANCPKFQKRLEDLENGYRYWPGYE